MAAGNFLVYSAAKKFICSGVIDLDSDSFRLALYSSASNAANMTLSVISQVTNEVVGIGYVAAGQPLANVTWTQGSSAKQQR
jgi:hypothetical protein